MAIIIKTRYPHVLIDQIKRGIDNKEIETWCCDSDGDFTHSAPQWANRAWFRAYFDDNMVTFGIIGRKGVFLTREEYGLYHGRFTEMLMSHFSSQITEIIVQSPLINDKDSHKVEEHI